MNLELTDTDDLIAELLSRYDHALFAGMKVQSEDAISKDGKIVENRKWVGNTRVIQGLCFEIMCRAQASWEDRSEPTIGDSTL